MTTSGPVVAGRYGVTLWTYPVTGTFQADRERLIGNDSAAVGQVGVNISGAFTPPTITQYRTAPVGLDGSDIDGTEYDEQTVVVPVVVWADTAFDARTEWRRIVAAVSARHRRAALEVTVGNVVGQAPRWLTRLALVDMDEQPLRHDRMNYFVGRLVFVTDGQPFWTPNPGNSGPGPYVGWISNEVNPTDNSVYQLSLAYPGTEGAWPYIQWSDLAGCDVSLTLASTGQQVAVTDTLTGSGAFDFDRRRRDPETDSLIAPYSELFMIPPENPTRVDVFVTGTPGGSALVRVSCLPAYSTV